jgi:hypothetical protein
MGNFIDGKEDLVRGGLKNKSENVTLILVTTSVCRETRSKIIGNNQHTGLADPTLEKVLAPCLGSIPNELRGRAPPPSISILFSS